MGSYEKIPLSETEIDHSSLKNLSADDHTQYIDVAGDRKIWLLNQRRIPFNIGLAEMTEKTVGSGGVVGKTVWYATIKTGTTTDSEVELHMTDSNTTIDLTKEQIMKFVLNLDSVYGSSINWGFWGSGDFFSGSSAVGLLGTSGTIYFYTSDNAGNYEVTDVTSEATWTNDTIVLIYFDEGTGAWELYLNDVSSPTASHSTDIPDETSLSNEKLTFEMRNESFSASNKQSTIKTPITNFQS